MGTLKRVVAQRTLIANKVLSQVGILVTPRHYSSSAPDLRALESTRAQWVRPSELPGVHVDLDEQVEWLRQACTPYAAEYARNALYLAAAASGPGYGYVEAQALHGILRALKPARYVEVGSGVSTCIALNALAMNADRDASPGTVTCVEPYPSPWLTTDSRITLHRDPVQAVGIDIFTSMRAGDVLFIDSSHTVKPGSDVNFLVLEVLPRLASGVVVHFHDIYLPYDYQRNLFQTVLHWSETSLVRAWLTGNAGARILACMSHLHYERTDDLKKVFPDYRPQADEDGFGKSGDDGHFPASLWVQIL